MRFFPLMFITLIMFSLGCSKSDEGCSEGFEGINCETVLTPTTITIKKITATRWPETDAQGASWDSVGRPDLEVHISRSIGPFNSEDVGLTNLIDEALAPAIWEQTGIILEGPQKTDI